MALIELQKLCKTFYCGDEEIHAVDHVDLTISRGEFVALTGPSGSGKSTLLYILGLLDRQTSGQYFLDGTLSDELSDSQRARLRNQSIGFVFQNFHLLPRATALRNVALPLIYAASHKSRFSSAEIKERAKIALERVALGDRFNHRPNELSGGQRQRVAVARALINQPSLLLADEPTGNLDSKTGHEILDLFHQLHQEGVSIVLVTHDQAVACAAPRQIKMFDGRVVEDTDATT